MPLSVTPTRQQLLDSLQSAICPACGKFKLRRQSYCLNDYRSLSKQSKIAIYGRIGHGYEEAFIKALEELGVGTPVWPPPSRWGDR